MNRQFEVVLVIAVLFVLGAIVMKVMTIERLPFGFRVAIGSVFIIAMLILSGFVGAYGR